jgi:hypothetical protein
MSTWIECRFVDETRRIVLGNDPVSIGRSPTCTLSFPTDKEISRVHAIIERRNRGWVVADQKSTNGTFLNGQRVTVPALLREGDVIQLGEQWIHVKQWVEPEVADEAKSGSVVFGHFYNVLRLPKHASQERIHSQYRELARIYDPVLHNMSTMASDLAAELEEAYATLGDPTKRQEYDLLLEG